MATINEALKKLFLGLGGDPDELKDNSTVSDYIDDLESAIKAAATAELPTPAEANVGKVATVIENEGAYSWGAENVPAELPTPSSTNNGKVATVVSDGEGGYTWGAENVPDELPTPAVGDIGKVVSVVSDGESGAEYALETPSGGGDDVKCQRVISINGVQGSSPQVNFNGVTRQDIIDFVAHGTNPIEMSKMNISAYFYYATQDYSVNISGVLLLNGLFVYGSDSHLPIFTGIIPAMNFSSATSVSGDLYQVVFILGATAADDRLEVIKLTTT